MIISTVENIFGQKYEIIGLVLGSMVQTKHMGHDFLADLKSMFGGELKAYTKMIDEARDLAISRMEKNAKKLGADAIIGFRLTTSSVAQYASEIVAYGTAVKFKYD